MAAWLRAGDRHRAARAGQRVGATLGQLGLLNESLRAYLEALPPARESGDRLLESELLSDLGAAQALVADGEDAFARAHERCVLALDVARRSRGAREEARAVTCLGHVAYYHQRPQEALASYRRAEKAWEALGDQRGRAEAIRLQGAVYSDLSRLDQAQASYRGALALWTAIGDEREQAIALILDARLKLRRGEYQEALNEFDKALTLLEPMGDAVWEGSGLTGLATVYRDMGEAGSSLPYWERAFRMFETAGLETVAVDVLMSLGETHLVLGDDTAALREFERTVVLADRLAIPRWKAYALRYIGVIHLFRRQPREALDYVERSLGLQRSLDDEKLRGRTLADRGEARAQLGEPRQAVRDFESALALSEATGDRVSGATALSGLARAAIALDDLPAARRYVERSLEVVESLRTEVESRELRASYLASVYRYHELHVDVLMRLDRARPGQGLAAAAFEASERARARSLLDSLKDAGVDLRGGVDPTLLKREQMAKGALDDWAERQARLGGAPGDAARALAEEYRELERRYDDVQAEIRSRSPHYAALTQPRPLRLREIQEAVLDPDSLLLEYALGEERSYLWAVSIDGLSAHQLPPRAEIEQAARRAYERLTARLTATGDSRDRRLSIERADADYWQEAARLSEILLGPVARRMAGRRILVVADGALLYLPFAALPVPGRSGEPVPLIVEHEIVSLPSASVLAVLRRETRDREPPAGTVAVLADPVFETDDPRLGATRGTALPWSRFTRLAATRQEADAIVSLVPPGQSLRAVGFLASRATAMSPELARYRIVHFATHGVFDNDNPGLSGIVLSMFGEQGQAQDGVLRLRDVYGLRLPAELVVLSACNTALGRPVRGEGLVGIVRGFMYAGARRVVASLWKVDDVATGEMMKRFYREMLEENRSPAAALREAQVALWRRQRWSAPFYWAAFVLQGELR